MRPQLGPLFFARVKSNSSPLVYAVRRGEPPKAGGGLRPPPGGSSSRPEGPDRGAARPRELWAFVGCLRAAYGRLVALAGGRSAPLGGLDFR